MQCWDEVNNKGKRNNFNCSIEILNLNSLFGSAFARKPVLIMAALITKKCGRIYYHMSLSVTMWTAMLLWEDFTSPPLLPWTWPDSRFGPKKVRGQDIGHVLISSFKNQLMFPPSLSLLLFVSATRMTCHKLEQLVLRRSQHEKRLEKSWNC